MIPVQVKYTWLQQASGIGTSCWSSGVSGVPGNWFGFVAFGFALLGLVELMPLPCWSKSFFECSSGGD